MAAPFIDELPEGYQTQLGRWFQDGRELSGGQWQKIALSRAFMREDADILVLDEPTAAMDAEAEVQIFDRFRAVTSDQMAILISHRFSTVRMADHIVVLSDGRVAEEGSHEQLMANGGPYSGCSRCRRPAIVRGRRAEAGGRSWIGCRGSRFRWTCGRSRVISGLHPGGRARMRPRRGQPC